MFTGIINGQGKKSHVPLKRLGAGRDQNDGIAALHPDGAVGLIGKAARFKDNLFAVY